MSDKINKFPAHLFRQTGASCHAVPSQAAVHRFVDDLTNLLFPLRDDLPITEVQIAARWERLQHDFFAIVRPLCTCTQTDCESLVEQFFNEIPSIYDALVKDANRYNMCDPASYCAEEVILCYPGFYAIMVYRIAHVAYKLHIPVVSRVMTEYAHSKTGIDINPGAQIGPDFYIDHGTGIVIGETTVIGRNVCLYQGVTLGATYVDKELRGQKRHPTIEDNVIIYAGSTILGGNTVIGHDTVIGGNVWLTESVPPHSTVYHKHEIRIKPKKQE